MDLDAVRTFVAVVDAGQFSEAAADLSLTQQAVSKRVAALEKDLGVRLFARTPHGAELTIDGQAFLPHARELLQTEERAAASVRPGRRALRVDVIGRRVGPAALLRAFHRAHPEIELDVVTLFDFDAALAALRSGTIDASFRAVTMPGRHLPESIRASWVYDEPLQVVTGPGHVFATARAITPAQLAGHRIWMPGMAAGTEWGTYYGDLAAAFGLTIEGVGPNFGIEVLFDAISGSAELTTFVGKQTPLVWPAGYDLRLVALRDPMPVYPHSLLWREADQHPGLGVLRGHLMGLPPGPPGITVWAPRWAQRPVPRSDVPHSDVPRSDPARSA